MIFVRRTSALGLVLRLATAAVSADTIITGDEIIPCWSVETAGADSVHFTLPRLRPGILSTLDVYEIRLSDSSRVASLAAQLPGVRVVLDSGQPVPPPAVRAEQLQQDRARGSRAGGLPGQVDMVDTLARNASPVQMAERCRAMRAALLGCGRSGTDITQLLRDVDREEQAVQGMWPRAAPCIACGVCGGLVGGTAGLVAGAYAEGDGLDQLGARLLWGCGPPIVGMLVGMLAGTEIRTRVVASHRDRVNDLIRRVDRAVVTAP